MSDVLPPFKSGQIITIDNTDPREKSGRVYEIMSQLALPQITFLSHLAINPSVRAACEMADITMATYAQWSATEKELIKEAIIIIQANSIIAGKELMHVAFYGAVQKMVELMASRDERVAFSAAKAIMAWSIGLPPKQKPIEAGNTVPIKGYAAESSPAIWRTMVEARDKAQAVAAENEASQELSDEDIALIEGELKS